MELRELKRTVGKAILRALIKHKHSLPLSCLAYFNFNRWTIVDAGIQPGHTCFCPGFFKTG